MKPGMANKQLPRGKLRGHRRREMNEREHAEKMQQEINGLVDQARSLLHEKVQGVLLVFGEVGKLLGEAEGRQHQRSCPIVDAR